MGVSYRGGKPVGRQAPRRRIPKGGISYRGGKPISGVSPPAGVSVSKYQAAVPFMQASYVTAGMPGMTAKGIAMFTKAATMPSRLTHSERAYIRERLPSMRPEYRQKFVQFETQERLSEKLEKKRKGIAEEYRDVRRVGLPGITTGLLYGVTPETTQLAERTWKQISGVKPISFAKMGVAISPIGIATTPFMVMGKKLFPSVQKEAREIIAWKPKAERKYERVHIETVGEMAKWERTPEGVPITPYELTPEAKGFKREQEKLVSAATERGWKTPEGLIEYPATGIGKEWALEYKQMQELGEKYITPEGFYREEYYVPTKEAAKTLKQVEWLEKRGEEMASPTYMAKERTEGMWIAPAVIKAAEFGEWWEKEVATPFEKAVKKYPRVVTGLGMAPMPIVTVPRYVAKKGVKYFAPEEYKPHIEKMPLGVADYPVSFKVGVVKGIPDIPIMAAEVGYGAEWIARRPKEAAMIAPGVAAYIGTGMVKEAITHPVEFAGRMAAMSMVTGGIGKVVRPVIPKYIKGVKVTDTGMITYKGLGLRGIKEPYPMAGMWKEAIKTQDIAATQRALILGKEYPVLRRLKAVKDVEFAMPEFGVGARVFGKQLYTEMGIGKAIKHERMRMEGLFGKDYLLAEKIVKVPEPMGMPKIAALPSPKPVLWERAGPTAIAERVTSLMKTKPIREWGFRIEKPIIPTYAELAAGRAYRITMGYDAFQIGRYPKYLKTLGLGKGVPTFTKGIEKIIHPLRRKVPAAYEPSVLDYRMPKGLLTEGLILDISRAKIRPTERPPAPIEKLYERITPKDVYREFGVERGPIISAKEVLKPIESRYLKWTAEGELMPQPEMAMPKPKRKVEVATKPEIEFDFDIITEKAIKPIVDIQALTKTMDRVAKETIKVKEDVIRVQRIEAFGKVSTEKQRIPVPFISGVPTSIFEQVEKDKEKYESFPFIPARAIYEVPKYGFKGIAAIFPKVKPAKKEKPFAFMMPKYEPSPFPRSEVMPKPFEGIKFEPMPVPVSEPVPEPVPEPIPFETIKFRYEPEEKIFVPPPPPPDITFLLPGEERKPRKRRKRYGVKEYPWKEKHYIPTIQELMRHAPGMKTTKLTTMEPKMPKLPKGIM